MGLCVSSAVAPPIFAVLLNSTQAISAPYLFFGIFAIVLGIIMMAVMKAYPEEAGAYPDNDAESAKKLEQDKKDIEAYQSPWTVGKLLTNKQVWFVGVGFGLLFIGIMGTITQFVPRFMASGFDQPTALVWLTITSLIGIAGSYAWGYLDQKTSTRFAAIVYAIYMAVLHFLNVAFFDSETASIVLIVLFGILIGGIGNLFPSMVIQVFGRYDFATANGVIVPILTAVRACTFIIMPIVLGATHGDYRIWHVVLGVIACVGLLFVCLMNNKTIGKTETGADETVAGGQ
jgi:sugar phosphate permease